MPFDSLCLTFLLLDAGSSAVNRVRVQVAKKDKQRFCLLFVSNSIDKERINTWTKTLDGSLMFFNVGLSPFWGNFY